MAGPYKSPVSAGSDFSPAGERPIDELLAVLGEAHPSAAPVPLVGPAFEQAALCELVHELGGGRPGGDGQLVQAARRHRHVAPAQRAQQVELGTAVVGAVTTAVATATKIGALRPLPRRSLRTALIELHEVYGIADGEVSPSRLPIEELLDVPHRAYVLLDGPSRTSRTEPVRFVEA